MLGSSQAAGPGRCAVGDSRVRYVKVESTGGGSLTDPQDYLKWLAQHAEELPHGARAFATQPEHYDFSHQWCPRSASVDRMSTRFTDDGIVVTLVLAAYGGAPPEFVLRYEGVTSVESDGDHGGRPRSNLLVDESLPDGEGGVRHDLAFTGGTITVVARDLTAGWSGPGAPEDPRDKPDWWLFDNPATLVHHLRLGRNDMGDRAVSDVVVDAWLCDGIGMRLAGTLSDLADRGRVGLVVDHPRQRVAVSAGVVVHVAALGAVAGVADCDGGRGHVV